MSQFGNALSLYISECDSTTVGERNGGSREPRHRLRLSPEFAGFKIKAARVCLDSKLICHVEKSVNSSGGLLRILGF